MSFWKKAGGFLKKAAGGVVNAMTGGLGGFVADTIGGVIGNAQSASQARDMAKRNAAEATINREFQERMANTSYQRKIEDLKAAGLNPALAYESGGAISPSGSTASGQAAHAENPTRGAVNSALSAAISKEQRLQMNAQTHLIQTQAAKTNSEALVAQATAQTLIQQARENLFATQSGRKKTDAETRRTLFDVDRTMPKMLQVMQSEIGRNVASAGEMSAQSRLLHEGLPFAEAMANFYRGKFGKQIAPYLHSAKDAAGVIRDLAVPPILLRRR